MEKRGTIEDKEDGRERRLKDKKMNTEGEKLVNWLEEERIINGAKDKDEEGEMMFTGGRR